MTGGKFWFSTEQPRSAWSHLVAPDTFQFLMLRHPLARCESYFYYRMVRTAVSASTGPWPLKRLDISLGSLRRSLTVKMSSLLLCVIRGTGGATSPTCRT